MYVLPVCIGTEPTSDIYLHVAELYNTSITLRWSASNNSVLITSYNVTVERTDGVGGQTTYSVGGDERELNVSDLMPLNTYAFSLLAMDNSGTNYSASPITVEARKCKTSTIYS